MFKKWIQKFLGITEVKKEVAMLKTSVHNMGGDIMAFMDRAENPFMEPPLKPMNEIEK